MPETPTAATAAPAPAPPIDKTFVIGLSMAGAISAGAYSAGILDFLFQALDAWEAARGTGDVPDHRVVVGAVSGASAGAITGALGLAAFADSAPPKRFDAPREGGGGPVQPYEYYVKGLYDAWVVMPQLMTAAGRDDLLSVEDLAHPDEPVRSLLNAERLDAIARAAQPDLDPNKLKRPYIGDPVHLFVSVANIRGVPYRVAFGEKGHDMVNHGDRIHYRLSGLGSGAWHGPWAEADKPIPVTIEALADRGDEETWRKYADAALASGAFPIGLRARVLDQDWAQYEVRQWPFELEHDAEAKPVIRPRWPAEPSSERYDFVSVDGGLINNEPFEMVRWAIKESIHERNPREPHRANRAVLMIDPFPRGPEFDPAYVADDRLMTIAKSLLSTLKDQARFKPAELALAADQADVFSRFFIAPRRWIPAPSGGEGEVEATNPIACGALGGFGGFLDQAFRDHDFQLGRRNCQQFLRTAFAFATNNPCFTGGSLEENEPAAETRAPMIPLVGTALAEVPEPAWPKMDYGKLDLLEAAVRRRAEAIVPRLLEEQISARLVRWGAQAAWSTVFKAQLLEYVRLAVLEDLLINDLIDGTATVDGQTVRWRIADADQRRVVAALADPRFDARTLRGIARETELVERDVAALLAARDDLVRQRRIGGTEVWHLRIRPLSWLKRNGLSPFPVIIDTGLDA